MTTALTVMGDVRSTILTPLLGWKFEYNINPLIVSTTTSNGGSVDWADSTAVLSTTTATTSSSAQITSIRNLAAISGLGVVVRFTAAFTAGQAGTTQLIGLGDAYNGFFFGYNGTDWGILQRQNNSDTWTAKADWSQSVEGQNFADTIVPTTLNAYQITFPASRVGLISFYIQDPVGGTWILVHTIEDANSDLYPAIYHVNLPLIAQVANLSTTSAISLYTSSASAFTEGTESEYLPEIHEHVSASVIGVTTATPILSVQNATTFASVTNGKTCTLENFSVAVESGYPVSLNFLKNATLDSPSWTSVAATSSVAQYDTSSTVATGGTNLYSFMFSSSDSAFIELESMQFVMTPGDIITISAEPLATTSTDVFLTVGWEES